MKNFNQLFENTKLLNPERINHLLKNNFKLVNQIINIQETIFVLEIPKEVKNEKKVSTSIYSSKGSYMNIFAFSNANNFSNKILRLEELLTYPIKEVEELNVGEQELYKDVKEIEKNVSIKNNLLKVFCSCIDFEFTFAFSNFTDECLYGEKPSTYTKTTDRQPKNPKGLSGCCKHLLCGYNFLLATNILK